MASWLPRRQGAADSAAHAAHHVATDSDGGQDEAYRRLTPDIERGDPRFVAKVAEFQALLDVPGQSLRNVLRTAGFTAVEQLLLVALPSPCADADLYHLQHKQRLWYDYGRQQRGLAVDTDEPPAVQLALCWFGAPFASFALDADDDDDDDDDNSVPHDAYRPDEDDGNSLQFLDKYSLSDYRGLLFNLVEDSLEDQGQARPRSELDHYLHRLQKRYPLRGGAADSTDKTPRKSKAIRLYGFQGAVHFDIYSQDSLADAVARLLGPAAKVTLALYTVAPARAANGKPYAARPPRVDVAGRTYNFRRIQDWFAKDGAEDTHALFVCALDEQPPAEQWVPYDGDPAYAETVVYCARTAASNSHFAALHARDEAYLRLPLNAEDLSPNQYFAWMLVVARILTPGAGLDALHRNASGVLARSHVGLVRHSDPVLFDPKTPGGLSFSPRSWEMLVCDAMDAWAEKKPARAAFDVVPVGHDMVSVHLPGAPFEIAPISAAAFAYPASLDDPYNVRRGAPFRRDLAATVHQLLRDALTAEEHAQLDCVNIWPDGRFWHDRPISVALGDFGDELKGFEDRWVVRDLQAYMHCVPSAAVIRPIYQSYTAILGDNVSMAMGSHDTLAEFRDRLRRADVAGLDPDTDHLYIRQTANRYNMYPELNPDMTETQRKQANRPGFFIAPQSTDEEWQLVRSQIISPTIWISHADVEAALRPPMLPLKWGFREQYGNLLDVSARTAHDRLLDEYWEMGLQRTLPKDQDGGGDSGDNDDGGDDGDDDGDGKDGALHHASDLQHALAQGDTAQLNTTDASSTGLPPLHQPMPCPYTDCGLLFGAEEGAGRRSAGDFAAHCEQHFLQKEQAMNQQSTSGNDVTACASCDHVFAADSTDTEKLQHLIDAHNLIYSVRDKGKLVDTAPVNAEEGEAPNAGYQEPETTETQSGLPTPPSSATKTAKRKRRVDPSYRPDQDEHDTEEDNTNLDSQGISSGSQSASPSHAAASTTANTAANTAAKTAAKKAGRAAKRRKTAEKDSIYRPQQDGDEADEDDDNLQSDVDSLDSPVKKTAAKKRKRDREADPLYRPGSEETDEDVVETVESADGASGHKTKKKKTGLDDPSFRPQEPAGQLYVDDQDEELRRSAVPEWEWDPADPAGKRKRVIRETGTALAKTAKAKSVSRAATPARPRAATPVKTGPRVTPPPAEETRRSGRSRQPPQRLI